MDIKSKYQYTYFLYPFIVNKENYVKIIKGLLKNKNYNMKIFDKIKDLELDTHFLEEVKKFLFPTFYYSKEEINKFNDSNVQNKLNIIKKMPSVTFEYNMDTNIQGKMNTKDSIFFDIDKIEVICFNTGICFISFKTRIESDSLYDVLNFNYKFSNINNNKFKDNCNIKIQTNKFTSSKEIISLIKNITRNLEEKNEYIPKEFFTYSYLCIDSNVWNREKEFENITNEFIKFKNVLYADYSSNFEDEIEELKHTYTKWKYSIYGFSKKSGVVLASGTDTFNFTKLPFYYETVYFYIMLLALYKRTILLKVLSNDTNAGILKNGFFTEITTSEHGINLWKKWHEAFELYDLYEKVKNKYEYFKENKANTIIAILFAVISVISIYNLYSTPKITQNIIILLLSIAGILIIFLDKKRRG